MKTKDKFGFGEPKNALIDVKNDTFVKNIKTTFLNWGQCQNK